MLKEKLCTITRQKRQFSMGFGARDIEFKSLFEFTKVMLLIWLLSIVTYYHQNFYFVLYKNVLQCILHFLAKFCSIRLFRKYKKNCLYSCNFGLYEISLHGKMTMCHISAKLRHIFTVLTKLYLIREADYLKKKYGCL